MHINEIIEAIELAQVRVTDHAREEAKEDQLTIDDVLYTVIRGGVIENYPANQPPRCLIYGQTAAGRAVHSVWAYNRETRWAVLVTVYCPDPTRWTNWRKRR